ncbi:MAG: rhodanese-like domain-containing protein [Gammaproteobacteria bacterium]|nr:rhodanese-like domain-containing protein [Gammaproteobacteria bacterium]
METYLNFIAEEWLLFSALIILLALLVRSVVIPRISGLKEVNVNEAVRLIDADNTLVLDVRLDREYETGHVAKSTNIPVGALPARIGELEKYKSHNVLVVCQSGARSVTGGTVLRKHGFANVFSLRGGMNAWSNANMPVTNKRAEKKKKREQ